MLNSPKMNVKIDLDWRKCFGCGQDNPSGFKLKFEWDGRQARAEYTPGDTYQGWENILHGGVTALLLDEAMGWAVLYNNIPSVTASMDIKFRKPIPVNEPLVITGAVMKQTSRTSECRAAITLKDGTVAAECQALMFIVARANYHDPAKAGPEHSHAG